MFTFILVHSTVERLVRRLDLVPVGKTGMRAIGLLRLSLAILFEAPLQGLSYCTRSLR
jgi:hypothetical protein